MRINFLNNFYGGIIVTQNICSEDRLYFMVNTTILSYQGTFTVSDIEAKIPKNELPSEYKQNLKVIIEQSIKDLLDAGRIIEQPRSFSVIKVEE